MASRKEGYDERIIECAEKEFLEKGYNDASLRRIANSAGVSTSTIYTRFKDKEGLFLYLIEPTSELPLWLENKLQDYFSMDVEKQKKLYKKSGDTGYVALIDIIYDHYNPYKLLVSCSPGNVYEDYLENIVAIDTKYTLEYLEELGSKALLSGQINEEFCHVVSTGFYSALFHCLVHDMTREEAHRYTDELRAFYGRGWKEYFR